MREEQKKGANKMYFISCKALMHLLFEKNVSEQNRKLRHDNKLFEGVAADCIRY